MASHPLDGSLPSWGSIASEYDWDTLLLGNGLSINTWPRFAYRALLDHAHDGGLTANDRELFDGTPNFERVLADLNTAIRLAAVMGLDTTPFQERYRRIQLALGHAVREVHLNRWDVERSVLAAIRQELLQYEWIFTTAYDLLLYWAMGSSPNGSFQPFVDLFRWANRCEFDPQRASVEAGWIPVYFLHGALHLVVGGDGTTWKLRRNEIQNLLDQFGEPIPGDAQARPLLVTEGSARDKIQAIEGNVYLSHALDRLRDLDLPIVIFGSSLNREDQHLVDALNEHPGRPVAVSLYPAARRDLAAQQSDVFARLEAEPLLFFDSTTHPLGSSALCAT
jgi:hypothetical protein